jgi:D-alanyl-lipoteichoic acid acyltransferase DltB (MBOAT superfamily)
MEKYEKTRHTGPVLCAHLLEQITSSSAGAVLKVTQNLVNLTMDKFAGESIPMACKSIRACFKWLDMVHKMPADPESIVLNILETCTVPEYLRYGPGMPSRLIIS